MSLSLTIDYPAANDMTFPDPVHGEYDLRSHLRTITAPTIALLVMKDGAVYRTPLVTITHEFGHPEYGNWSAPKPGDLPDGSYVLVAVLVTSDAESTSVARTGITTP